MVRRDYEVTTMEVTSYGVKRKREWEEQQVAPPAARTCLLEQRKSILDISMIKLKMEPCRHEPSLRRSVLIFNTLKSIENELKEEGVKLNPASTPCLLPAIESGDDTLDHLPPSTAPSSVSPAGVISNSNSYPCQAASVPAKSHSPCSQHAVSSPPCVSSSSSSPSTSTSSSPLSLDHTPATTHTTANTSCCHDNGGERTSVHSSAYSSSPESWDSWVGMVSDTRCILDTLLGSDRLTVTSLTSLFDLDSSAANGGVTAASGATTAAATSNMTGFSSPYACENNSSSSSSGSSNTSSTLTPTNHDACLADLDLSLLDFDLFSGKLPSLNAEELTSSLPTCGDAFPTLNPKYEHFSDDLDHIMQVLVGI